MMTKKRGYSSITSTRWPSPSRSATSATRRSGGDMPTEVAVARDGPEVLAGLDLDRFVESYRSATGAVPFSLELEEVVIVPEAGKTKDLVSRERVGRRLVPLPVDVDRVLRHLEPP